MIVPFASVILSLLVVSSTGLTAVMAQHSKHSNYGTTHQENASESQQTSEDSRYIVKLSADIESIESNSTIQHVLDVFKLNSMDSIKYEYPFVSGYAISVASEMAASISSGKSFPGIEWVEVDSKVSTSETVNNAPWGLQRISQREKVSDTADEALNHTYSFDSAAGSGTQVYLVDTGCRASHTDFGGRAKLGPSFGYGSSSDGNGHGTHITGTAIGEQYGVAKSAEAICVKVLGDDGSGMTSDVIAGIQYVAEQKQNNPDQSMILSLSLGGSLNQALDDAIAALVDTGVHVSVAAGNDRGDACNFSPGREPSANTVAAMNIADDASPFSNYGSCVDIWAPGQNVVSSWFQSDTSKMTLSGTSMAAPHVSGLIAYLISVEGDVSPSQMSTRLRNLATYGALSGVQSGTDALSFNGFSGNSGRSNEKRRHPVQKV